MWASGAAFSSRATGSPTAPNEPVPEIGAPSQRAPPSARAVAGRAVHDHRLEDQAVAGRHVPRADLVAIAREAGLKQLVAEALMDNIPMLRVFEKSGLPMTKKREPGIVHARLDLG